MKYIMSFQIHREVWDKTVSRFLETGAPAPEGIKMLGRWHAVAGRTGFILMETDDASAMFRFASEWHDVCDLKVTPVVDDEEAGKVLSGMRQ